MAAHQETDKRQRTFFDNILIEEMAESKRMRSIVLIALLGFQGVFLFLIYLLNSSEYRTLFETSIALFAVLIYMVLIILFESFAWFLAKSRPKKGELPSPVLAFLNIFLEISLLSLLLVFIVIHSGQTAILMSPAALTYFIFIILSTLRLDYRLPVFTGIISAIQFILLAAYYSSANSGLVGIMRIQYLGFGLSLVTAGLASGFVTNLIKKKIADAFDAMYEKKMVIDMFGQQISQQIVSEILNKPSAMIGKRRQVTIMFLDIRGFSAFVDKNQPEAVVSYLNKLFSFMIQAIERNGGVINQFLGDGFMATFGAPVYDEYSCQHATNAAIEILQKTKVAVDDATIPPTRLGIGLHYGEAVTGNIGSSVRKQYSITGNVVVVASRIEQLNKKYNTNLLISYEVWTELDILTRAIFTRIGAVQIKGSTREVNLYKYDNDFKTIEHE